MFGDVERRQDEEDCISLVYYPHVLSHSSLSFIFTILIKLAGIILLCMTAGLGSAVDSDIGQSRSFLALLAETEAE